jgi:hypothetical protein
VSSQESGGGHMDTLKSQDFPSQNFSRHCILGYYCKHASIYGIVNLFLGLGIKQFIFKQYKYKYKSMHLNKVIYLQQCK